MEIFLTGLAAFVIGVAVSYLNFAVTRALIAKKGDPSIASPVRAILTVAFIAGAYFLAKALEFSTTAALVGAALGLTAGLAFFTFMLMKKNEKENDRKE